MPERTGQRLILQDGTQIENGSCGYADGRLWCWVTGYTMPEAAQVFFNPEKTGTIRFEYGEMADEYEGYTVCTNLLINDDGQISVCLKRGG